MEKSKGFFDELKLKGDLSSKEAVNLCEKTVGEYNLKRENSFLVMQLALLKYKNSIMENLFTNYCKYVEYRFYNQKNISSQEAKLFFEFDKKTEKHWKKLWKANQIKFSKIT